MRGRFGFAFMTDERILVMKIFANIPQGIKILNALKIFKKPRKLIYEARDRGDFETERKYILESTSTWGKLLCDKLGVEIEVTGRENLPAAGPVVYVSNHQSYADIIVHCAVLDTVQFGFVAKQSLADIPLYGQCIKDIRSVMMNRDEPREALKAIMEAIDLIQKGFSILIFPEGTRSKGHEMAHFKRGSLRLATKPGVPVIPITIDGTYKIYEETGVIRPAKVRYIIHKPIETTGMDKKEASDLAERTEEIVRSVL